MANQTGIMGEQLSFHINELKRELELNGVSDLAKVIISMIEGMTKKLECVGFINPDETTGERKVHIDEEYKGRKALYIFK